MYATQHHQVATRQAFRCTPRALNAFAARHLGPVAAGDGSDGGGDGSGYHLGTRASSTLLSSVGGNAMATLAPRGAPPGGDIDDAGASKVRSGVRPDASLPAAAASSAAKVTRAAKATKAAKAAKADPSALMGTGAHRSCHLIPQVDYVHADARAIAWAPPGAKSDSGGRGTENGEHDGGERSVEHGGGHEHVLGGRVVGGAGGALGCRRVLRLDALKEGLAELTSSELGAGSRLVLGEGRAPSAVNVHGGTSFRPASPASQSSLSSTSSSSSASSSSSSRLLGRRTLLGANVPVRRRRPFKPPSSSIAPSGGGGSGGGDGDGGRISSSSSRSISSGDSSGGSGGSGGNSGGGGGRCSVGVGDLSAASLGLLGRVFRQDFEAFGFDAAAAPGAVRAEAAKEAAKEDGGIEEGSQKKGEGRGAAVSPGAPTKTELAAQKPPEAAAAAARAAAAGTPKKRTLTRPAGAKGAAAVRGGAGGHDARRGFTVP